MNRDKCRYCGDDLANDHDFETIAEGEGQHLCWARWDGCQTDAEDAINRLNRELAAAKALAESNGKLAHDLAIKCQELRKEIEKNHE